MKKITPPTPSKKQIKRALIEIENPMPEDNLINDYADFLKVRDYLHYQKFNPSVLASLLSITISYWHSKKRISRISLLQSIKKYLQNNEVQKSKLSSESRKQLFELFRKTFEENIVLSEKQLEEAQQACNLSLINVSLTSDEEQWLCKNTHVSELILNRVLRYPSKSKLISNWAKANYDNNNFRNRRAELISWRIDENPDFEVSTQTLIDDFEYFNKTDRKAIEDYLREKDFNHEIQKELNAATGNTEQPGSIFDELVSIEEPELTLTKRFYKVPKYHLEDSFTRIPDFEKLENTFYDNLEKTVKVTMIWAIGYSRLSHKEKLPLFKKYFDKSSYYSLLKVAQKTKNVLVLKWMIKQ